MNQETKFKITVTCSSNNETMIGEYESMNDINQIIQHCKHYKLELITKDINGNILRVELLEEI